MCRQGLASKAAKPFAKQLKRVQSVQEVALEAQTSVEFLQLSIDKKKEALAEQEAHSDEAKELEASIRQLEKNVAEKQKELDEAQAKATEAMRSGVPATEAQPVLLAIGQARGHAIMVKTQRKALEAGNWAVVITLAPKALASWIAVLPIPDEPPCTKSVSPAVSLARSKRLDQTVK